MRTNGQIAFSKCGQYYHTIGAIKRYAHVNAVQTTDEYVETYGERQNISRKVKAKIR